MLKFWFYKGQEKGQKNLLSSKFMSALIESLDFDLLLETEEKVTPKCQAPAPTCSPWDQEQRQS